MEESGYRFGVGVLVLASIVIGMLLVVFFGAVPNFLQQRYTVTINFDSAPGVANDTPVRKAGVLVGRVASVKLLDDDKGVDLTLELDSKTKIKRGELAKIKSGSFITGDALVEFVKSTPESLLNRFDGVGGPRNGILEPEENAEAMANMQEGDLLRGGEVAGDPMNVIIDMQNTFASTLTSFERTSRKVETLAVTLDEFVNGSRTNLADLVAKTKGTLDRANQTLDTLNSLAAQVESSNLPQAFASLIDKLPTLVDEAGQTLKQAQLTLKRYEETGDALNATAQNIQEFTEPWSGQGERFAEDTLRTLANLDAALMEVRRFAQNLNNGQGTIAKLTDDPQLYFTLLATVQNIETLTRQLQPVARNVNVLTDKLARDPGGELINRAFSGRPIGLGVK